MATAGNASSRPASARPGSEASQVPEDQEKRLAEAFDAVKRKAFFMKQALDANNLREALKHSSEMLGELRTSALAPQKYYELYMKTFDELRYLEAFFADEAGQEGGRGAKNMYEVVQHAGNILPRLYLLCTVGGVLIKSKEAPSKEVLKDLVEMTRGVQHPLRGLFLRSYLSQVSKDKLPDAGNTYEGEGGKVEDSVDFVLTNFTEMNKLWVRMQHQGPAQYKEKRERERKELADLVGKNLLVLSQLEGVDRAMYQETVLPRLLEQVLNCKDRIAQQYLMDCIIQVFPDEFHLATLAPLLDACPQLLPTVSMRQVMGGLMSRLATYYGTPKEAGAAGADADAGIMQGAEAFNKVFDSVAAVCEAHAEMPAPDCVALHAALIGFALAVCPSDLGQADRVLSACAAAAAAPGRPDAASPKLGEELVKLLKAPLAVHKDIRVVLQLQAYPAVLGLLSDERRREVAMEMVRAVVAEGVEVATAEGAEKLLTFVGVLVTGAGLGEQDDEDLEEDQQWVARLIHNLRSDSPQEMYSILLAIRRHLEPGGPERMRHTLPALAFHALRLARDMAAAAGPAGERLAGAGAGGGGGAEDGEGVTVVKVFQFTHQVADTLAEVPQPEPALRLFLRGAEAASQAGLEDISYEFFTQAFMLYEESVADSKAQVSALQLIVGTLQRCHVFGEENRAALVHKATVSSTRLLRKPDQCRAVYACASLFWGPEGVARDGDSVLVCLKRALKIAHAGQQMASAARGAAGPTTLFVEILNKYIYFFDQGCEAITSQAVQGVMELAASTMSPDSPPEARAFLESTLKHIRLQKGKGGEVAERYEGVVIPGGA